MPNQVIASYRDTKKNERMEKIANEAMEQFDVGLAETRTNMKTMTRELTWQVPSAKAEAAKAALEKLGFRAEIREQE